MWTNLDIVGYAGCDALRKGDYTQQGRRTHSEACRIRIEGEMQKHAEPATRLEHSKRKIDEQVAEQGEKMMRGY